VIDDLRLFLEPASPAGLTDLSRESLSEFIRKGSEPERRTLFAAVFAFHCVSHLRISPCEGL